MVSRLAALLLFISVTPGGTDWGDCGNLAVCVCKWSSGKKTASCPSAGLISVPLLSPDIQVLDLHDNVLANLDADVFATSGLVNLQRINLRAAKIKNVHVDAFRSLSILVEVDLADNDLREIVPGTFRGNERLRLLVLSGNPMTFLAPDVFPLLPRLRTLDLSECRLKGIDMNALNPLHLPLLDALDLSGNVLPMLFRGSLARLPSLKTLRLSRNPWKCDCRLREFRSWYLSANLATEPVYCAFPASHANISWRELNSTEMTCPPQVSASTKVLRAEPGTDVTFGCLARGDPRPNIFWTVNGHFVDNDISNGEILLTNYTVPANDEIEELPGIWVNVSISNVTRGAAGDWICLANSTAGIATAGITLVFPRARTATARSPPEKSPPLVILAGAIGALLTLGMLSTCACWHTRRRSTPGRRLTDQEKKLLDSTLAVSGSRSSAELSAYELPERPQHSPNEPVHITIEGTDVFPPPAEFALPAQYRNIYISVSVNRSGLNSESEFPDLLGSVGSTLPHGIRACCSGVSTYDNMGPRVTAAGSSTWSLSGSESTAVPAPPTVIVSPPPPEFVAL